jgi:hypothetical protein
VHLRYVATPSNLLGLSNLACVKYGAWIAVKDPEYSSTCIISLCSLLTRLRRRLSEILRRRRKRSLRRRRKRHLWRRRLGGRTLGGWRRNAAREEFDNVVDAGVDAAKKVGESGRPTRLFSVANSCHGFFGRLVPKIWLLRKRK